MRQVIYSLVFGAALTGPLSALDLGEMTDQERAQFRDEVRSYLLDNPEIIMEAVAVLEQRELQAQAQADLDLVRAHADEIFNDGYSWVGGNPDGDITLVEFLDYRCGFCKRAHGEVAKLLESDGNIRLIVKEFPVLGAQSVLASRFAIATRMVAGDAAYKDVTDALMTLRNPEVDMTVLADIAAQFDLDLAAIEARMDTQEVTDQIVATQALAQKLQITGTPTFVLQDEMLRGFLPYDQMVALVAQKRE